MKVLLVGGGGREAAIAWAIGRSPLLTSLACAPGNAGIERHARRIPIAAENVPALVRHALAEAYDLVVIGPEAPLVSGLADRLREAGLDTFGPSAAAALIEGSKVFSKEFMARHRIPTAAFRVFDDAKAASRYLRATEVAYPLVVKADGLAAGKGVVIAPDAESAVGAATHMLSGDAFGYAGRRIVVEEMLHGRETSFFVLADGNTSIDLAPCQDYKRAEDADRGPNTGGMGTCSPSAWLDDATKKTLDELVVAPTIRGLAREGRPFRGVLFIGVILTEAGPKVLEYNARFGDPETQVLMPRLWSEPAELFLACARGELGSAPVDLAQGACVTVVLASGGYPGAYDTGFEIRGLDAAERVEGATVFHSGTAERQGRVVTAGGRVLSVSATGASIYEARDRAYHATALVSFEGMRHRTDIAAFAAEEERR